MANPFDQFDSAKPSSNPFDQFDETPAKPSGALRKAIGDKVVGFASGAVGATKALADAAGAGNTVSNALDSANNTVNDYLSPEEKASQQARSARTEQAKGTGAWNEFKTGVQNFAESPIQQTVTGVGSVVPVAIAALGGLPAAAATGIGMGVGTVKGRIYDDTKKRGIDAGLSASDAEAQATKAQDYTGENADQIALGGALGAADALTGVGRIAGGALRNAVMKPAVSALPKAVERGVVGRAAMGALGEVPLEAAQGGQEQLATNIAAQRQGVNVDTWSGVAGQATEEGLASLGAGAGAGALHSGPKAPPTVPPVAPTADPLKIGNTPDPYISFPDGTVARRSEVEAYVNSLPADQQPAARAKMMGLAPQVVTPEQAPPAGPPAQLGYSPLAGTPTIHPDGTVTLNGEQEFQRRTQSQPAKPSEQMGLTPTVAPSLTNAAITAVDTGAHQAGIDQQTSEADQATYDAHMAEQDTTDKLITHGDYAEAQMPAADLGATLLPNEDIHNGDGFPYSSEAAAQRRAKMEGKLWEVAPTDGGWKLQKVQEPSAKQSNLDRIRKANNVSGNSGVQPISATSGGQDGNNAPASVGSGASDANGLGANAAGSKPSGVGRTGEQSGGVPASPVAKGRPQPTTLGTQTSAKAGPGFSAKDVPSVKNPAPAASGTQAKVTPDQAPQAVAGDAATAGKLPGSGSDPVQANGVGPASLGSKKADMDHLFGIPQKRSKAIERIAKGTAYFGKPLKAQEFIAANGLKDTHQAVKTDRGWDVVAKAKPVSQPQEQTNGTQAAKAQSQQAQPEAGTGASVQQPATGSGVGGTGEGVDHASQWARTRTVDREAIIAKTDLKPIVKKNIANRVWGDLNRDIQKKLAAVMDSANVAAPVEKPATEKGLGEQLAELNAELERQGATQDANTRARRDSIRKQIAEQDFPEILKAVDDNLDTAEELSRAFQYVGDEPKAKTIERVLKKRGITPEYQARWTEKLLGSKKPATVNVPPTVVEAFTAQMQKQKGRITRLKNEAEKAGSLEDKRAAQLKVTAAEATLRQMRLKIFDAEDAAVKSVEAGNTKAFAEYADLFPGAAEEISKLTGQQDELDAEMRAYEAKAEQKPPQAQETRAPVATETVAKADAKAVLSEKEKAAKAKMFNALGKLAHLAGKNTRMNWTQEEEQQLLPIVIELFDGAMDLGAVTFQKAVAYVREFIASGIDQETADAIPFETLQGAYISVSGRHKDKNPTNKKEVAGFDSLEELAAQTESADTSAKEPTTTADETPKESLLGANDDTRRNATNDSEPLDQTLQGPDAENGQRGNAETGAGLRPTDAQGNGRPESGGAGRRNSLDGSEKPVLPSTPAEIRPLADGPIGKTEDRPQQLSGENPGNFVITDDFKLGQGTDGDKISGNLNAIRTLREIQKENRYPTKAEQATMARYVGWGGLKTVFDPKKADATDQYGKAQRELKALLSPDEYRAANGSIRNAHYTAEGIVDGMWRVMRFMGFKGGRALEPTVGIGNFVGRMPADMAASTEWHASELDTTTGQLAAMLYPEANILASTGFQDAPFADGAFDISVGNPPFGAQTILDKSPNRKHLNGQKIHNYIIAKAGMHLRPGGVMSMVVTHRFLDTANPEARDVLAKDFRFLGAFRLPNDAFKKNAGTDVVTDVVFLQKLGAEEKRERDSSWLDVNGSITVDGQAIRVNRYYQDNPAHILGRSAMDGSMQRTGEAEYTVHSDGRDIGKSIDELMQTGFQHMAGVLDQSNSSKALAPAMLTQSDLPIGGVMVNDEGKIIRRELNDDDGNAVLQELTPETLWKDQAAEWQALQVAVLDVKNAAIAGKVTQDDANEVLALSRFLFKADGTPSDKPTKAVEAVYKLVEDLAKPEKFQWTHDSSLLLITAALNRKQLGEDGYQSLKGMLDLRNRTLRLIHAEQSGDVKMEEYRADLNKAYDAFVKENGYLSDPKNANLLEGDVGAEAGIEANYVPAVSPAVAKSSGTPARAASAKKSDIMARRVNFPYKEITHADSAPDALFASISEHGKVDLPYMAKITNKSVQSVIEELTSGDNPQLFRDPETGEYQEAERYLSGNVKHKLKLAKERGLQENIKALEKSLPKDKTKAQVKPNIRGMWMPQEIFTEFLQAIGYQDAKISVIASQGMLQASGEKLVMADFGVQFRHEKRTPMDMFNSQASGKPIIISYTSGGKTYKDEQGTKEVNALAERMGKVFQEWAYSDDDRVKRIVEAFNQNMNTHAPRTFDGVKYLKPVGASPSVVLRRTQLDGAWRMMQERTMLADHVVGAGKTFTLITGIMERRRMGLSRKPMVVVPNHLVTQWARDFYKLYPGAKVLAANPADFSKKNRRRLLARIATGDYDAVIVGHTSIGFMETPTEDLKAIVDEKLEGLKQALAEARLNNESKRTLGQIEDRIDRYEQRLKDLAARPTDDIGIDFKALGIDHLSVDEAHEFKNLEYSTSGDRVVGMNDPNGSKKAFDLYSKVRGLLARGGGVTFATGTPVSNSLVEIYTMMSYLAHDELVLRGQDHFDSWSGAYAATETRLEYTATQKLKPRRVLAGLNNLSALRQLYEQFADIITMADLKRIYTEEMVAKNQRDGTNLNTEFPVPKVANGKRELIAGDITPAQKEYMDYLVARMGKIEQNKSNKEYMRIDNALNVLTDARKMSLDIRIVDPGAQRDENGKVATAAKNIKATYDKWDADRGTQLVFCDLSTPAKTAAKEARSIISATVEQLFGKDLVKRAKQQLAGMPFEKQWAYLVEKAEEIADNPETSEEKRDSIAEYMSKIEDPEATMNVADIGFSVYDDLKTVLMNSGIPESEIAFIHDYNTPDQKEKLFDRVNNGYVRVLIGSSAKMGAGTNAQRRLVALHHMDAPWRPSDVEQREGRIIRQGNTFHTEFNEDGSKNPLFKPDFEVEIKAYSTNQTSDTVMWQILQRKAGAIEQFREGGLDSMEEEGGDSDQYAEFMATSTGNPVFRQKLEAERRLTEIESEIGGALIVRSNANSFLESYDRRRKAAKTRQEALETFDASTASYGGESGTQAEFEAAMKVANDDYLVKYATWTQKNASADLAIAKWETQPEDTRGDKPSKPTMPSQPDLYTKSVQTASGYARAIGMALNEAAIDKNTKVTMATGSIIVTGQTMMSGPYWTVYANNLGENFSLDSSGAQKPSGSPRLIQALMPFSLRNELSIKAKSYARDIVELDNGKTEALKGSILEVDTSERDAARVELRWFAAQVAFAEVQADIDRGASKNRYIERDKRRNISQTQAVALTEPVTHTIDGVKYTTTGLLAYAGYQNVSQATRDSDGVPAIIVKQDKGGEITYAVAVQPEKLRKASKSTNLKQTGAPEGNTSNVVFSRPRFSRGAQSQANESVERLARGIASHWENPPKVVIAFDMNDPAIPESVRNEDQRQRSGGATGTPEGFYYKGTVYLMSSKLGTPNDIARVLFHESLGHYGLRGLFGKSLKPILNEISMRRRADVDAKIKQYGLKMGNKLDRFTAAEEVLAELAQTRPEIGIVQRAIAAIRTWLRQNVPGFKNMRLTDAEIIRSYILPARAFVENSARGIDAGRVEPTFSRVESKQMFGRHIAPLAMTAYKSLSPKARDAVDNWNVNWSTGPLVKAFADNTELAAEIRTAFQPVRDKIRSIYGDTIPLYRGESVKGEKPSASSRTLYSWTPVQDLATQFATNSLRKIPEPITDAQIDAAVSQYERTGYVKVRGHSYLKSKESPEYFNIYDRDRQPVTDGDDLRELLQSDKEDRDQLIADMRSNGVAYQANVPVDKLVWVPVGANLTQPEIIAEYNPRIDAAEDVAFSRSIGDTLTSAANSARDVNLPAGYKVGDLFNAVPGKLNWWHKTVGTQYNLAQRSKPFKRVYDSVQNFINDVSYFATEAADLAPNILPKLESWKDIAKSPLSAEDTQALSKPVFEGTLTWSRDESGKPVKMTVLEDAAKKLTPEQKAQRLLRGDHISANVLKMWQGLPIDQYESLIEGKYESDMLKAGIVFTPAELKSLFGLNDKQVSLYQEFRKATDKSLTNLAVADMLRFGGKDVEPIREAVLESNTVGKAAEMLRDYLLSVAGDNGVLVDTANKMIDKGDKAQDLIDRGYAPLSRFGTYTLDVVDAEGERAYFGMFESAAEASKMRRKMEGLYPGATITQGTVSEQAYKMFAGVSPETLELFGDMLGLESQGDGAASKAFQEYLKLAKSSRSAMKRLIQRKGIAGFSEDAGRVLAGFVYSNARQTASSLHMGEMTNAANDIDKTQGELKDAAVKLVDYIKTPQEEAQALRGLLFAQYIGGSVASAMVNMTQPVTMTFPWLSQYGGVASAAKQMTAAMKDSGKKTTGDAKLDAALHRAEEDGTVSPQEVHQLMQQSQGRGALQSGDGTRTGDALAKANNALSKVSLAWGKLFGVAEQFNRRVTFIAAYRTAVAQGIADPDGFARKAIAETQGVYNKGNKPSWARGAVGSTLFTFKQYSIAYVEMLSRMAGNGPEGKKAALLALAVLFLLSGAGGMPGADDLDDVISGAMQSLGYNFDSKMKRKEFFVGLLGEGGAQFVERGVSGLPGVPIDVSGRMGLGNLIPGTGLFTKKADHTRDVAELAGPAGDFVKRGFDAAGKLITGDVGGAVDSVSPKAIQNLTQAYDMANRGMYRDAKGMKVLDTDGYDALAKAVGFQPNDVKRAQDANFEVTRMIGLNKINETDIANRWAMGVFEKDAAKIQEARDDLAEWNRANPESPIRIDFKQIRSRVQKMNETKAQRISKTAPREIRAAVRQELASAQ